MKIPNKLKIGGHVYKVIIKQIEECGEQDSALKTITISQDLAQSIKESTLIHEIMHAMNAQTKADNMLHALMESWAEQLYQVLSDNKLLN